MYLCYITDANDHNINGQENNDEEGRLIEEEAAQTGTVKYRYNHFSSKH